MAAVRKGAWLLGVVLLVSPLNALAASGSIRRELSSKIDDAVVLGEHDLSLDVRGGVVTLRGEVASAEDKALLDELARTTKGVREVRNNLSIVPAGSRAIPIESARRTPRSREGVAETLLQSVGLSEQIHGNYRLEVGEGRELLVLRGEVSEPEDRGVIEQLAQRLAGERQVINQIAVQQVSDEELTANVLAALRTDPQISTQGLQIKSSDGVVSFYGSRPNHRAIDRILATTLMVPGVRDIESEMTIRPESQPRSTHG